MKSGKLTIPALAFTMTASILAGCAGNQDSTGSTGSPSNTAGSASEAVKTVELSMLASDSLFGGIHNELIEQFQNENPNIKIKLETIPAGSAYETLRIRLSADEVPDVFQINIGNDTTELADESGYIADLSEMESMQNFAESIKNASVINGKIANFSLGAGVLGFNYNKKMLADAGFSEPPKTWDELMELGAALKASGKDMLTYASKWETGIGNVFHWAFGALAVKDPAFKEAYYNNTIDWTVPEYRAALQEGFERFKQLNEFVRIGSFTNEFSVAQQALTSEESAMSMGGTWEAGTLRKLNPDLDWGLMNLPYAEGDSNPYVFVPEDGLALNAKSEHPEEAKKFLNWLFSKETYAKINKAKGSMSSVVGVGDLDPAYTDVPNWLNTDRVVSFANTGPIPNTTWVALGQAAQQYTFDGDLEAVMEKFIKAYEDTKSK